MPVTPLAGFPGIGIDCDTAAAPFFEMNLREALTDLAQLPTGRALLQRIANARPGARLPGLPDGVNVVLAPPPDTLLLRPGTKADVFAEPGAPGRIVWKNAQGPADHAAWRDGGIGRSGWATSSAIGASPNIDEAARVSPRGEAGPGSTVRITWSNTQSAIAQVWLPPFIPLGHELIHALHYLEGMARRAQEDEEHYTVGLAPFADAAFTENRLRAEARTFPGKRWEGLGSRDRY
jgi:hypothetical protein